MRWWTRSCSWFAVALGLVFLIRAVFGLVGGLAESEGRRLAAWGYYEQAIPQLERAAIGEARAELLWLTAQSRLGLWHERLGAGASTNQVRELLLEAYGEYTETIAMSPASGWYRAALSDLYHQVERVERFQAGDPLQLLGHGPWAFVGRPGRVAIGLARTGIELEPSVYNLRDQLAFTFSAYRLNTEALAVVRESARVQPIYRKHAYKNLATPPDGLVEAFALGARESLDETPYLRRVLHLLALGRLELRRGDPEQARRDLEASLEVAGDSLNRAEAHYYLGLVHTDLGHYDRALEELGLAEQHPNFEAGTLAAQARVFKLQGRLDEALVRLRRARGLQPRRLDLALEYAQVAGELGEWDKAEEALRWAALVHPRLPSPLVALARVHWQAGDRNAAQQVIEELRKLEGTDGVVGELETLVGMQRDSRDSLDPGR
jgi:tetratricopeptide (TPR) repeat protein